MPSRMAWVALLAAAAGVAAMPCPYIPANGGKNCYKDEFANPILPHFLAVTHSINIETCYSTCASRYPDSVKYIGLEGGTVTTCYCGAEPNLPSSNSDSCTVPCPSAPNEICGGPGLALSLYVQNCGGPSPGPGPSPSPGPGPSPSPGPGPGPSPSPGPGPSPSPGTGPSPAPAPSDDDHLGFSDVLGIVVIVVIVGAIISYVIMVVVIQVKFGREARERAPGLRNVGGLLWDGIHFIRSTVSGTGDRADYQPR